MSNKRGKVVIAAPVHPVLVAGLNEAGYNCEIHEKITQATAAELLQGCTGIITSTRLQIDRQLIDALPGLKWIGRMGSGMEVIDVAYAASKGIACFGSPEGNCNAVGEHALGMLLALIRRINISNSEMKEGIWLRDENRGVELEGKTIGLIGFGHTGRAFAKKLSGFDVRILAYDKYSRDNMPPYVTSCDNLQPVYNEADIISFHVPWHPETFHYFNRQFMTKMVKSFYLINTSRGQVVDTQALHEGILNKKISGACLDVFETEPVSAMNATMQNMFVELMRNSNVITTPHIAGYTVEALYKMSTTLLAKILEGNYEG
ncbi:MAG: hydroxyacid dehydrogenase [Taibaiella sp.]|nr:hydroxyacid dehydrogenase [Taibaiella sp.]